MYIGIDLGTSSVKVIIMNKTGQVIDSTSSSYPLSFPKPGFSEQNPEDWWHSTLEAIHILLNRNKGMSYEIQGISFSGQMHGLVLLDENGDVLMPAILWNDNRTIDECTYLNQVISKQTLSQLTGNIALTGFTAPKLMWVKEHEPSIFKQIKHILLPKDYLRYKLTGNFMMDVTDASGTLFFDVKNKNWSKEMLDILSLEESWLPPLCESYDFTGYITSEIANKLQMNPLTKVIGGGGGSSCWCDRNWYCFRRHCQCCIRYIWRYICSN